jgi:hypothetical protein
MKIKKKDKFNCESYVNNLHKFVLPVTVNHLIHANAVLRFNIIDF